MDGAPTRFAPIAETKAASAALSRRDGASLRRMQEAWPAFLAQVDRAARMPIMAGAGSVIIRRADTILGALAVRDGLPKTDDQRAEAGLTDLTS